MNSKFLRVYKNEPALIVGIILLLITSLLMLNSLASYLFPQYFIYIVIAIMSFIIFSHIDFDILSLFSKHFYVICLVFLILPLIIGQATRGVIRWIPIGSFAFQPTELVRPFLIVFFSNFILEKKINLKRLILIGVLAFIPLFLILIQPSLGVTTITSFAIFGIFLSSDFDKRKIFGAIGIILLISPLLWFVMQDYQKTRILGIFGTGYNRIQSIIAVGSGQISGRGLGEGIQTQLAFLPEKHTDFIFASIAEEFGFFGTTLIVLVTFFILYRLIKIAEVAKNREARAFVAGVFLSMFIQIFVHMGMNMGIMPITGLPLPLVSAGGSSLIATMTTLGMVINAKRHLNV